MRQPCRQIVQALIVLSTIFLLQGTAPAIPSIHEGTAGSDCVTEGPDVLVVDYVLFNEAGLPPAKIPDHEVSIWIVLCVKGAGPQSAETEEDDWAQSEELCRVKLPGPSDNGTWRPSDEVAFRNFGIARWGELGCSRVSFRLLAENLENPSRTVTLLSGTVKKTENYDGSLYESRRASVILRTCSLPEVFGAATATVNDIWFEHEAEQEGERGLVIHVDVQVDNMRAHTGRLAAFVRRSSDGSPVNCAGEDPRYSTREGYLTVQENFVPIYTHTLFSDFPLFIPYSAFPFSREFVSYYVRVQVFDEQGLMIGSEESVDFEVLRPD